MYTLGLNTLVRQLDDRYEAKVRKEGGTMPRKRREEGLPSAAQPPFDAPQWTLREVSHVTLMTIKELYPFLCSAADRSVVISIDR